MADHLPDRSPDPPDIKGTNITVHLILNSTLLSIAPGTPVSYGAETHLTHTPADMDTTMIVPTAPVSYGAGGTLECYLSMIDPPQHVEVGVTINESNTSIVIPLMYPATLCVAITSFTTTTTQDRPLYTAYEPPRHFKRTQHVPT